MKSKDITKNGKTKKNRNATRSKRLSVVKENKQIFETGNYTVPMNREENSGFDANINRADTVSAVTGSAVSGAAAGSAVSASSADAASAAVSAASAAFSAADASADTSAVHINLDLPRDESQFCELYSPEDLEAMREELPELEKDWPVYDHCDIVISDLDSCAAAIAEIEDAAIMADADSADADSADADSADADSADADIDIDTDTLPQVLIMNYASYRKPGGGYTTGSGAQEETLCCKSTLYPSISSSKAKDMYDYNRQISRVRPGSLGTDYMILSNDIKIFRDENLDLMDKTYPVGMITIAAPNLSVGYPEGYDKDDIDQILYTRLKNFLIVCAANHYDTIITGAWGCGVFNNNPDTVAEVFKRLLVDEGFEKYFKKIHFAIYNSKRNQSTFESAFKPELTTV